VEQYYRDNRLNSIHEGTNGVQALDLLGRKVRQDDGAALAALVARIEATIADVDGATGDGRGDGDGAAELRALAGELGEALGRMVETTRVLVHAAATGDPTRALANASVYLSLVGRTVVAWLWLKQAAVAARALPAAVGEADRAFYRGKLQAARYYFGWELPRARAESELLQRLDATTYEMDASWF
jgi:hypothetical protein